MYIRVPNASYALVLGQTLRLGGYSCQPYCAVLPDESWTCVMTYIHAPIWTEGAPGEHMVSTVTVHVTLTQEVLWSEVRHPCQPKHMTHQHAFS